ncbi:hypothetical protein [Actinoallomurus sp. NPDC050550]|uniref:hypothetical protein n=1 Tax=Actinoallomurus sp. NPDC050550 TaxID=3154937 RepID=UPI0033E3926C
MRTLRRTARFLALTAYGVKAERQVVLWEPLAVDRGGFGEGLMANMSEHDASYPGGPPQDAPSHGKPSQGEHPPSEPRPQRSRSRSARLVWLTVGSVAVLLLGGVGIAFAAGGFGHSVSKHRSAAFSRTFTSAPPACDMVKPATIKLYTSSRKVTQDTSGRPGSSRALKYALCISDSRREEELSRPGHIYRSALWKSPGIKPGNGHMVVMDAELTVSSAVRQTYDPNRNGMISVYRHDYDVTDARQVSGLGDAAYIIYGTNRAYDPNGTGYAALITYWGNAEMKVIYQGFHQSSGTNVGAAAQQPAEAAVLAIARDIYASLG